MKPSKLYQDLSRIVGSGLLCTGMLLAASGSQAAAQNEISQVPPSVAEGVPPNMIFTLDESGSMSWGYTPDNIVSVGQSRRILSNTFNSQYYNPSVAYTIPPAFDSSGAEYQLSTSFEKAYHNGFVPGNTANNKSGYLNLKDSYRVTQEHRIPSSSGTFTQLANPSIDFYMKDNQTVNVGSSSGSITLGNGFVIKYNNSDCKVVLNGFEYSTNYCRYNNKKLTYRYDLRTTAVPAYYYVYNSKNDSSCTIDNEDCYSIKFVTASSGTGPAGKDERENFAIWFSFYKTRALATLSATSIAFYNLSPDVRFTWQNLDTCKKLDGSDTSNCGNNSLKPYTSKHKGEFYTWLRNVYFNKGTPLPAAMKRAGEYLTTSTPWEKFPGEKSKNTTENTYACRPSYHVMMTDGMWNATTGSPASFRSDHSTFTTPRGEKYGGKDYDQNKPFYDNAGNSTLADLAMHYWATDLNPNLDNKIRPYIPYKNDDSDKEYWDPRNNPAEWQHMTNFVMGLGLTTSLDKTDIPWAGSTHAGEGYAKLLQGTPWPKASSGNANNVYDLWHAAINSRGEFYSVDSPEAMVQAFQDILTRIAERKSSAAMPGTSSAIEVFEDADGEEDGRLHQFFYQTTFNSADGWSGDLTKTERYREYNETTKEFEWVTKSAWSAAAKLPAHNKRKIYMANSTGKSLMEFTAANSANSATYNGKTLAQHLAVNPEPGKQSNAYTAAQRLDYLRGSDASAGEADDKMRER
ncbi:MAG: pilus assembly protein PilY, partial [Gammaproteobacteria bacterium]|nr:pilus assembly protein PilY [Gammaproteobacteria bacterium]